jgi:hypothetical protein
VHDFEHSTTPLSQLKAEVDFAVTVSTAGIVFSRALRLRDSARLHDDDVRLMNEMLDMADVDLYGLLDYLQPNIASEMLEKIEGTAVCTAPFTEYVRLRQNRLDTANLQFNITRLRSGRVLTRRT